MAEALALTRATYASVAGARAYIEKERQNQRGRNRWIGALMDGLAVDGKRVLDMGCGFGRDVAMLRRRGAEAYGVDASPMLLAEARKRYGHADWWRQADVLALAESPVGKVDLIWCVAVLVHVPRDRMPALLKRWVGWLKPGGQLVIVTKQGASERMMENLGEQAPRLMVYYQANELLTVAESLGMVAPTRPQQDELVRLPTGDELMTLVLKKKG